MPTYEYVCKSCGEHTDAVQSFSDEALTVCPHCGGPLRKVFGNIGIAFKGSGFYKNDSRSGASAGAKANGSPSSTASEGAKPSTGDSPATTAAPKAPGSSEKAPASSNGSGNSNGSTGRPSTAPGSSPKTSTVP